MTKRIAVGTLKGGTGKTMSLFNLAGELAQKSRVLIVDCDPQCNLTANAGVDITDLDQPSIRDVFENNKTKPEDVIWPSVIDNLPKLDLIPSTLYLVETEMNLVSRSGREQLLNNWLKKNEELFSRYDYIMFDTNPSMGLVNQNVFVVADSIILVTDVGFNSIQGASAFTYLWSKRRDDLNLEDNVKALIINNTDKRIGLTSQLRDYIDGSNELSSLLVLPDIPGRVALKKTEATSTPITIAKLKTDEAKDAAKAVKDLVKNLKKKGAL